MQRFIEGDILHFPAAVAAGRRAAQLARLDKLADFVFTPRQLGDMDKPQAYTSGQVL